MAVEKLSLYLGFSYVRQIARQFLITLCLLWQSTRLKHRHLKSVGIYLTSPIFLHGHLCVAISRASSIDIALAVVEGHWQLIENDGLATSNFLYGKMLWSLRNVNKLLLIIDLIFFVLICIGTTSKHYFEVLFLSISFLVLYVLGLWPTLIFSFLFCLHEDPVNSESSSDRITILSNYEVGLCISDFIQKYWAIWET